MATLANITGRVLVQIGDNEPIEVGTIEIPIDIKAQPSRPTNVLNYPPGVRGGSAVPGR